MSQATSLGPISKLVSSLPGLAAAAQADSDLKIGNALSLELNYREQWLQVIQLTRA